ncbi:MAG: hypothetical protein ABSH32_04145 [Bryobacteraceae bacterium]|jgi:hypothetical protein
MTGKAVRFWAAGAVAACMAIPSLSRSRVVESRLAGNDLTVHEWGTFTSVAGPDGQAIEWLPLTGSTDLPGFVEHFRDGGFKCGLGGTVRMETPVLYFYSPHDTTVSVKVAFAKGLITEWYPHASAVAPEGSGVMLSRGNVNGSIRWDRVHLLPGAQTVLPSGEDDNHYYAARNTSATPVRVKAPGGDQDEKFLFYRGVSEAAMPVAARLTGGQVLVQNLGTEAIPSVMLLESRGGRLGYRVAADLRDQVLLNPPSLTASTDAMLQDLEGILIAQGLYVDEARAMIATWRNSWFEEGTRLLYILPAPAVNAILPLTVNPAPATTVRVFVGRLEIVTPATEAAVEKAFATHDHQTLDKYRRFLEPILRAMLEGTQADPARTRALQSGLNSVYTYACRSPWPSKP